MYQNVILNIRMYLIFYNTGNLVTKGLDHKSSREGASSSLASPLLASDLCQESWSREES